MSLWNQFFDSEYRQRTDIDALKRSSHLRRLQRKRDRKRVQEQEQRIEELEDHVGELTLLCRSLMTLLREESVIQPERLQEVMQRIDAEDGVIDGKVGRSETEESDRNPPDIQAW